MDLNGDARITKKEFNDSMAPMENFTKESLVRLKSTCSDSLAAVASASAFDSKRE